MRRPPAAASTECTKRTNEWIDWHKEGTTNGWTNHCAWSSAIFRDRDRMHSLRDTITSANKPSHLKLRLYLLSVNLPIFWHFLKDLIYKVGNITWSVADRSPIQADSQFFKFRFLTKVFVCLIFLMGNEGFEASKWIGHELTFIYSKLKHCKASSSRG